MLFCHKAFYLQLLTFFSNDQFDRDPESDAHEDLRQLTNLAQQFVNQYGFEDPAKLNELREQACQLMESDEIDPNVPFEDSVSILIIMLTIWITILIEGVFCLQIIPVGLTFLVECSRKSDNW